MDGANNEEENGNGDVRRRTTASSKETDNNNSQPSSAPSSSTGNANATNEDPQELLSANSEYCKQLEGWLWKCYWHRTLAISAYFTALNQQYGTSTGFPTESAQRAKQVRQQAGFRINFNVFANQQANNQQQRSATAETLALVKIAPIWKRLVAEVVDFVILMIVKLLVTFTIVDNFDIIDLDSIDLSFQQQDADVRISSLYDLAFTISSELIILEIIHRLIACIVEGFCLSKSGCTPGKSLLNLRVIHAGAFLPLPHFVTFADEAILPHPGNPAAADVQYVLVRPGTLLTFPRAFCRSLIKNFSLAFFFPLCFTLFHFDYSRTLYDMMGKSLVVDNN